MTEMDVGWGIGIEFQLRVDGSRNDTIPVAIYVT